MLLACLTVVGCAGESDGSRGLRCESAAECDGLACVADRDARPADLEPLPLVCRDEADGRPPRAECAEGTDCASGLCVLAGACLQPCAAASDCGAAERCQAVFARGRGTHLHPLRACVTRVDLPNDARVDTELRSAAFDVGVSELELPGSDSASLFVIEHLGDDSWPVPSPDTTCRPPLCAQALGLVDPASADGSLFDLALLAEEPDGPRNPVAVGDHVDPLTVLVPNGPRVEPSNGGYRLQVESKRAGDARVTRIVRAPSGGRLDLNLYVVGSEAVADGESEREERLADALAEVDRIFEPAGIFIGDVRQIHVGGALPDAGVEIEHAEASRGFEHLGLQYGVYPHLPALFELSAGASNPAIDVFFIASLDPQTEGSLGGIAGGTPLPLGMHGTSGSGIALASGQPNLSARELGRTLAHELGHALGLFHTTETSGLVFDPLPDTPVCSRDRDVGGDGLSARDCEAAGGDNLMFPTTEAAAATLTQDQRSVLADALILQ